MTKNPHCRICVCRLYEPVQLPTRMSKRKTVDDLEEFHEQLSQQEIVKQNTIDEAGSLLPSANLRQDPDGTLYEYNSERKAWFPKIDDNFIATYQMNYGCNAAESSAVDESYWTNPPADINSQEYRDWYMRYCQYYQAYYGQPPDSHLIGAQTESIDAAANRNPKVASTDEAANIKQEAMSTAASSKQESDTTHENSAPKPSEPPSWFEMEDGMNTSVYVSGLPDDITEAEYTEFMGKAGIIAFDPVLRKAKIKLYRNPDGSIKGDGRCTYIKGESVALALQILDGASIRGNTIVIEKAKFEMKGEFDPTKKRRKLTNREKKKFKEKQEKLLSWQPEKAEEIRPRCERVVVIKNLFKPADMEADPLLYSEISSDIRDECSKYGDVRKVIVYDRNAEGVAMVTFRAAEEADACISAVNGRWFAGARLEATAWDGVTKYLVEESEQEMNDRLNQWHRFLEHDDEEGGARTGSSSTSEVGGAIICSTSTSEVASSGSTSTSEVGGSSNGSTSTSQVGGTTAAVG